MKTERMGKGGKWSRWPDKFNRSARPRPPEAKNGAKPKGCQVPEHARRRFTRRG